MVERQADGKIRTTEWEDIQYRHGNKVGQYRDKETLILAQKMIEQNIDAPLRAYNPVEERVNDKADRGGYDDENAVEVDCNANDDEDDDDYLAQYRAQRRQQIANQAASNVHGRVKKCAGTEYVAEVTEASADGRWVVCVLIVDGKEECDMLLRIMDRVAARHKDVKFVSMPALEAIKNLPVQYTPCVLLYRDGKSVKQYSGLDAWGGKNTSVESVEQLLGSHGVVPMEDADDGRDESLQSSKYYARMQ